MNRLRHSLPAELPDGWSWPARPSKRGYWMLTWRDGDGRPRTRALHLCVAEVERIPEYTCYWCGDTRMTTKYVIDHVDGDKGNCLPDNLVRACNSCNRLKGLDYWGPGVAQEYVTHTCVDRRMCDLVSDGDDANARDAARETGER